MMSDRQFFCGVLCGIVLMAVLVGCDLRYSSKPAPPEPVEPDKANVPALSDANKTVGPQMGPESVTRAEFEALKVEVAELRGALKTLANEPRIFNITQPVKEREVFVMPDLILPVQETPPLPPINVTLQAQWDSGRLTQLFGPVLDLGPKPAPKDVKYNRQRTRMEDGKLITTTGSERGE